MATSTAKITCHNPVTGDLVEDITFQMFYSMQFVDGRKVVYVNGTGTFELGDDNEVIAVDMLPFRPRVEGSVDSGPIDPQTGIALNDVVVDPSVSGPDAVFPPGTVPTDPAA